MPTFVSKYSYPGHLLLASIWIRPDNAIVALIVLLYLGYRRKIPLWIAAVLIAIAFATPIVISQYGSAYSWKALYSHTFKFVEMAPGEFVPTFTIGDYLRALRAGVRTVLNSSFLPYVVLGAVGYKTVPEMRTPLILCLVASAARFLVYPNFEPRYYALLYSLIIITVCTAASRVAWIDRAMAKRGEHMQASTA